MITLSERLLICRVPEESVEEYYPFQITGPWSSPSNKSRIIQVKDDLLAVVFYDQEDMLGQNNIARIGFYNTNSELSTGVTVDIPQASETETYNLDVHIGLVRVDDTRVVITINGSDDIERARIAEYNPTTNLITIGDPYIFVQDPVDDYFSSVWGLVAIDEISFMLLFYHTVQVDETTTVAGSEF